MTGPTRAQGDRLTVVNFDVKHYGSPGIPTVSGRGGILVSLRQTSYCVLTVAGCSVVAAPTPGNCVTICVGSGLPGIS